MPGLYFFTIKMHLCLYTNISSCTLFSILSLLIQYSQFLRQAQITVFPFSTVWMLNTQKFAFNSIVYFTFLLIMLPYMICHFHPLSIYYYSCSLALFLIPTWRLQRRWNCQSWKYRDACLKPWLDILIMLPYIVYLLFVA